MNRMKHVLFLGALIALAGIGAQRAAATDPSLQDFAIATDGGVNFYDSGSGAPGLSPGGYNLATGVGTYTFIDTNVGSDTFAIWWDEEVSTPIYNEYGTAVGTPASEESWEIGDAISGSIYGDASYDTLSDTNSLAGNASGYLVGCVGAACNGDVSTALGYNYTLSSNQEEVITLTVLQTAPCDVATDSSCFYLDQTHPADANNPDPSDVYFSLSAEEKQIPLTGATPEPSTWLLMLTGLLIPAWRMRRRFALKTWGRFTALLAVVAVALSASARAQQVLTVPWDPTNPAAPHTAYAGANIVLGATLINPVSGHNYTYIWNYGDGTPVGSPTTITNFNDIHGSHIYPFSGTPTPGVTSWTAVVTVNDTTASVQYTGNYLVIWENNTLQSRVNVAIDWGLWYLHQNMYHPTATTGTWARNCAPGYPGYACYNNYGGLDANNAQAFEVNGHLATGPATDPYTSDVAEGLADMLLYLNQQAVRSKSYTYNPATANFGCSDGTAPTTTNHGSPHFYCDTSATPVYYEPSSTSCGSPPCSFTFDGNSNGLAIYVNGESWYYEPGMFADALVASGKPALTAASLPAPYVGYGSSFNGSIGTESFKDITQDIVDAAAYCQYGGDDYDVEAGYSRGSQSSQGGGWWYNCQQGGDNSVSQWAAIGLIAAQRGFGITIPPIVTDANSMWVTASQNVETTNYPVANNPADATSYDYGGFGYNGASVSVWGTPWALTPSGMVQMSLDGIGRTANVAFGAGSNDPDQRFNSTETYYADNFCNPVADGTTESPLAYTYGMFSFTKSMLLHNPGGVLTPIQYLRTQTPNAFTGNISIPANTIDWYAALSKTGPYGGSDPCDGVAQTLLNRQYPAGFWYGSNYSSAQFPFETAWALIMLQKSVFVACVNNLGGAGTASGTAAARIDLTWTGIPSATGYEVLRSTTNGSGYLQVGTTATTAYSDRVGLTNGGTYYYVLQPLNASGTSLCQSNQATITIPAGRSR